MRNLSTPPAKKTNQASPLGRETTEENKVLDSTLRPQNWEEYIGQEKIKQNLRIIIEAANKRGQSPDHLLFYGGSGLGKCVNKDSVVFTKKGMVPIGNLGNLSKKGFQKKKIQIYSNPGPKFTSYFYNNGESKTIKITTHQNYELEGTSNHPIVASENGEMIFKQLKNLRKGDFVAIQRGQNFFGNKINLPKFNFTPPIFSKHGCYRSFTIPKIMTKELARLLGYLVGDGYIGEKSGRGTVSFTNENPKVLKDFQTLWLKVFNQSTKTERRPDRCPAIRIRNIKIRKFLISIGLPYCVAQNKKVAFSIMQAPKKIIREFLRAYFECDGHIRPNCRQMEASSTSKILLKQIQIVLLNFGIISRIYKSVKGGEKKRPNPNWRLSITGGDVDIFLKEIGFITKGKNQVIKNFSPIRNTNKDLVPFGKNKIKEIKNLLVNLNKSLQKNHYRLNIRGNVLHQEIKNCTIKIFDTWKMIFKKIEEIKQISNPQIFWDKIKKIEKGWAQTVDLTVLSSHTFFANGFISHNTTLAHLVAKEIGSPIRVISGPVVEKAGDLAAILTNLSEREVLFIDECHRLNKIIEEYLYPAMEDYKLNLILGRGPMARTMELKLPRFTLVGATTRPGLLSSPLRNRFGATFQLNFYESGDIEKIIQRSANLLGTEINPQAIKIIASRSRFNPRIANRLLKRVRDFAQVEGRGIITKEITEKTLVFLDIDGLGLEPGDRRVLETIINKFNGGPVGLQALAAASSEEEDTILDIYEPYLMQLGFIERTPRGRIATKAAYQHLKIQCRPSQNSLI